MNKKRRDRLRIATASLQALTADVRLVCDEETDALGNWPESLENTDRYRASEDAIDAMEDAIDSLQTAAERLSEAVTGSW